MVTYTSSYKTVRQLLRKGFKIAVRLKYDGAVVFLQKTDWLEQTKDRVTLTNYDGGEEEFTLHLGDKYIEFCGSHL
jgi:hypothetical protein